MQLEYKWERLEERRSAAVAPGVMKRQVPGVPLGDTRRELAVGGSTNGHVTPPSGSDSEIEK